MQEPVSKAVPRPFPVSVLMIVVMIMRMIVVMPLVIGPGPAWPPHRRKFHVAQYALERDAATARPASSMIEWLNAGNGGSA